MRIWFEFIELFHLIMNALPGDMIASWLCSSKTEWTVSESFMSRCNVKKKDDTRCKMKLDDEYDDDYDV